MDVVLTGILAWSLLGLSIALYMIPTIVAARRRHRNLLAIAVTNIFLGWSVLGWIGSLIWGCTANVKTKEM